MASLRQWCSWGTLMPFFIATVLCIVFCFNVICNPSYQKSGLITILFDFNKIPSRGVALSVPTNPDAIPGVVSTAVTQAQTVVSGATTAASSAASEAQSEISSAVMAIQTAVDSIPKNCSLGVKKFCIGFADHIDCQELPLNVSKIVPSSITAVGPSNFEALDRVLAVVNPGSIIGCLALGLFFAILAIFPDVISICSPLAHQLGLISLPWIPEILAPFRAVCSAICCIPILALAIILFLIKPLDLPKGITIETGEASNQVLAASTCAIFMSVSITVGWLLDRQSWGIL